MGFACTSATAINSFVLSKIPSLKAFMCVKSTFPVSNTISFSMVKDLALSGQLVDVFLSSV